MANFFIYRINGGEVDRASQHSHNGNLAPFFAEVQDPSTPDGTDLAVKKIFTGGVVRNATAQEITGFVTAKAQDDATQAHSLSEVLFNLNNLNGVALKAIAAVVIDELNTLRQWIAAFKVEVAAATNLANLQSRVASLPNMPDRTAAQARTAIKNAINSGAND